jgi:hypothetical protein
MTDRSCLVVRAMVAISCGKGFKQGAHRVGGDGNNQSQRLLLARIGL